MAYTARTSELSTAVQNFISDISTTPLTKILAMEDYTYNYSSALSNGFTENDLYAAFRTRWADLNTKINTFLTTPATDDDVTYMSGYFGASMGWYAMNGLYPSTLTDQTAKMNTNYIRTVKDIESWIDTITSGANSYYDTSTTSSNTTTDAFTFSGTSITRTSGSFVSDGFAQDQVVYFSGTSSNNTSYTVTGVAALTLSVAETTSGETVNPRWVITNADLQTDIDMFDNANWLDITTGTGGDPSIEIATLDIMKPISKKSTENLFESIPPTGTPPDQETTGTTILQTNRWRRYVGHCDIGFDLPSYII